MSGPRLSRRADAPRRTSSGGWYCLACGTRNRADARFCLQCGRLLSDHQVAVAASAVSPTPVSEISAPPVMDGAPTTPAPHRVVLARPQREGSAITLDDPLPAPTPTGLPPVAPAPARMPWSRALQSPASQHEAWGSIFAFLAVVCVTISLTGIFARPMLVFAIPAIVLGVWCLRQRHIQAEFRWLAAGAFGIGVLWAVFWIVLLLTGHR